MDKRPGKNNTASWIIFDTYMIYMIMMKMDTWMKKRLKQ